MKDRGFFVECRGELNDGDLDRRHFNSPDCRLGNRQKKEIRPLSPEARNFVIPNDPHEVEFAAMMLYWPVLASEEEAEVLGLRHD